MTSSNLCKNDPAHPSSSNTNHTTTSNTKPSSAFTAITDPDFLPTLDDAPATQHIRSHSLVLFFILSSIFLAWYLGLELFQFSENSSWATVALGLGGVAAVGVSLLYWTGTLGVDWWELGVGWWWLSMPVAGAAGLLLLMAQEQATGFNEVD